MICERFWGKFFVMIFKFSVSKYYGVGLIFNFRNRKLQKNKLTLLWFRDRRSEKTIDYIPKCRKWQKIFDEILFYNPLAVGWDTRETLSDYDHNSNMPFSRNEFSKIVEDLFYEWNKNWFSKYRTRKTKFWYEV